MNKTAKAPEETNDPALLWGLSFAQGYFELGMLNKASKELDRLEEKHRSRSEVIAMQLRILLARRLWPQVVATAVNACRLFPDVPEFYAHAATGYDMLGQDEQARQLWKTAPEAVRSSGILHLHVARFEASLGNFDSARIHLHRALALNPDLRLLAGSDPDLLSFLLEHSKN